MNTFNDPEQREKFTKELLKILQPEDTTTAETIAENILEWIQDTYFNKIVHITPNFELTRYRDTPNQLDITVKDESEIADNTATTTLNRQQAIELQRALVEIIGKMAI